MEIAKRGEEEKFVKISVKIIEDDTKRKKAI
jgi:hypothetical protein